MAKAISSENVQVPPVEQWQGPMSWLGSPLKADPGNFAKYRTNAVFVRAVLDFTLSRETKPGWSSQEARTVPGLIRLEKGKAAEVHLTGFDSRCWTFRLNQKGRKINWLLFAGPTFPAQEPIAMTGVEPYVIEQVVVQTIVPCEGSLRHVSFIIRGDGRMEDLSKARDPDPED
ncbi:hypothetical protein BH10PLA2_BH10PLA2_39930 [soil metagenome]